MQPVESQEHAGLRQLGVVLGHGFDDLRIRTCVGLRVLVNTRDHQHHESHRRLSCIDQELPWPYSADERGAPKSTRQLPFSNQPAKSMKSGSEWSKRAPKNPSSAWPRSHFATAPSPAEEC